VIAYLPAACLPAERAVTMMKRLLLLLVLACISDGTLRAEEPLADVRVDPPRVQLRGPVASYSLLVHGQTRDGQQVDLTHNATFTTKDRAVARVTSTGVVNATGDGSTTVTVEVAGRTLTVAVEVVKTRKPRELHFENDVVPLLSRHGCNSSGCHGKAEGQNGFKLSVFGFDPPADYAALTKEGRGRRIFPAAPEQSLLLRKVSGQMAHAGGVRIPRDSADYATLRDWIAAGAPVGSPDAPHVTAIRVEPAERVLAMQATQQLRVIATISDGRERDVTAHARFQSNNEGVATVQPSGLVTAGTSPGDVAIMAGYRNHVAVFRVLVPRREHIAKYPDLPANNFIDTLVFRKLRQLELLPSELCDDATFVRRVYLDLIGVLPSADETRRFLADTRPDRRARLVDELLERPEYADLWALRWTDLLRVDRQALGPKRAYAYYKWIRDNVRANTPLDRFTRELLTADGPLADNPAASLYKVVGKPGEVASSLSQVFLGVRIACAECHHHPFDRWSQSDYYGMQAFFTPLAVRGPQGVEIVEAKGNPLTKHPRTGETIHAHALGMSMPSASSDGDRRAALAEWLTKPDNPWFARNLANRVWAHLLGRGLVEPVDDFRATNPPSNPELLDALAKSLVESKFDVKQLLRTITASRVYQLASTPNATNEHDELNCSRALLRRLPAEVMLDMICDATGVAEKFPGNAPGTRAVQLWDSKVDHYFLKLFGRPAHTSVCECERNHEPSVAQVLHLLNAPEIQAKLSHAGGRIARLSRNEDDAAVVEELYLTCYARLPSAEEKTLALEHLKHNKEKRRQAIEDLAWTLLNTIEFCFNH
jgi:hypothetical protein